jgi:hypothetical protein
MSVFFSQLGRLGRLGNQLFQIAATMSLAMSKGDTYIFPKWNYERYFNLHNCFSDIIRPSFIYQEPFFHYKKI